MRSCIDNSRLLFEDVSAAIGSLESRYFIASSVILYIVACIGLTISTWIHVGSLVSTASSGIRFYFIWTSFICVLHCTHLGLEGKAIWVNSSNVSIGRLRSSTFAMLCVYVGQSGIFDSVGTSAGRTALAFDILAVLFASLVLFTARSFTPIGSSFDKSGVWIINDRSEIPPVMFVQASTEQDKFHGSMRGPMHDYHRPNAPTIGIRPLSSTSRGRTHHPQRSNRSLPGEENGQPPLFADVIRPPEHSL
jgi:hypothetical protein